MAKRKPQQKKVALRSAHQQAVDAEIRAATTSLLVQRAQLYRRAGLSFNNARDMYEVLGYDVDLTPTQLMARYDRGGIAGRIVDAYPKACWRGKAEVIENGNPESQTAFEKAWEDVAKKLRVWPMFQRADQLSGMNRYSVILIGAPGELDMEMPKGKPGQLSYLSIFSEFDASINSWENDARNPRFGLPTSYTLRRIDISSPQLAKPVHWSRVLHIADQCIENDIFGRSRLARVWNLLDCLDKVTGGGAEAFWLNANRGLHLDVDKDMQMGEPAKTDLKTQADEYQHQIRRTLRTRGVSVTPLGTETADFATNADAILTQIAGSEGIPKRILTGSEMGQLASGQDRDNWDTQVTDRRIDHCQPTFVEQFVDRCILYGYLPKPAQYETRWPDVSDLPEKEKVAGAQGWAKTNQAAGRTVFTENEIRDYWYGLDPLDPQDILLDDAEDVADDDAIVEDDDMEVLVNAIRRVRRKARE